jgi:hypothetical protein
MAGLLSRWLLVLSFAALALALLPAAGAACPFCGAVDGQSLTASVNQYNMVLVARVTSAKMGEDFASGESQLAIEAVVKNHDWLGNRKTLTVKRYLPPDDKYKFLVFCDIFKDDIDPSRGEVVAKDSDIAGYLNGALKLKDAKMPERLKYFFNYLDNPESLISNDAFKEFAFADYKDYRDMARDLPADKVAKWLQDPNTPAFRFGLYASMLGHCGKDEHAKLLREMLDDPQKRLLSGTDGMLAGYTLLKPKEGWTYLCDTLKDSSKDFTQRYAALRATRFFWEMRPDVIDRKDVVAAVALLLDQGDIADLAIEDLRRWGRWEMADKVLGLYGQKSHDVPIIRRSILRYALSCKGENGQPHAKAAALVAELRKQDAEMVNDVEELLKLETTPPAPAKPEPKK